MGSAKSRYGKSYLGLEAPADSAEPKPATKGVEALRCIYD